MKKILIIIFCLPLLLFGQSVPQGVNYQAVATNSLGLELINQTISIRASVLSNSANGTIEWEEIHTTTTDTFGLFNLIIGQGTSTGNGSTSNFSDINWGANTHFLKIEMDINGGSTYSHMGTNQMMSVPYALYAENTNIDYDSIASILSNDSTFVTSVSGGINRNTDFLYPEGLDGNIVYHNFSNSYTVPYGKNLYIINYFSSWNQSEALKIDGNTIYSGYSNNFGSGAGQHRLINPITVRSGQVVSNSSTSANSTFIGLLTDEVVVPLTHDLDSNYLVPSGKKLLITNIYSSSQNSTLKIDGNDAYAGYSNNFGSGAGQHRLYNPIIVSGGQIITGAYDINFNGYLVDDDYFSSSSNSSTSSLDSITIANMIASSSNSSINYNFPDGLGGDAITSLFTINNTYTVPTGKRLYILSTTASSIRINSQYVDRPVNGTFAICNSGDIVEPFTSGNYYFNGYLVDDDYFSSSSAGSSSSTVDSSYIESLVQLYTSGIGGGCDYKFPTGRNGLAVNHNLMSGDYIVPSGKQFLITHALKSGGGNRITINGFEAIIPYQNEDYQYMNPAITNSGDVISNTGTSTYINISGVLIDQVNEVNPIIIDLVPGNYIVPAGKQLVITHALLNGGSGTRIRINGFESIIAYNHEENQNMTPIITNSGDVISHNGSPNNCNIVGYLVDENYFIDCGR